MLGEMANDELRRDIVRLMNLNEEFWLCGLLYSTSYLRWLSKSSTVVFTPFVRR